MSWTALLLLAGLALCVASAIRVVREDERLIVFRLGRFHRVAAPGLVVVPWGVESARRVDLTAALPGWQSLTEAELTRRLEHLATTGQLPAAS